MHWRLTIGRWITLGLLALCLVGHDRQIAAQSSTPQVPQTQTTRNNCSVYPSLQDCLSAAGPGAEVFVPVGVYELSVALSPLNGQTIECAGGDVTAQGGSILRPVGAIWVLENSSPSTHKILGVTLRNCVFDLSRNPNALGAINLGGISWAKLYNPRIVLAPSGTQVAIKFDSTTAASYWNDVFGPDIYATGSDWGRGNRHTCLLFVHQANDNHVYGGSCNFVNTGIDIQSGDNNLISGFGVDSWGTHCIVLGGGPKTNFNLLLHNRCETYGPSGMGKKGVSAIYIAAGATDNQILYPLVFGITGTVPLVDDSNGRNVIFGTLNANSSAIIYELSSRSKVARVGINKSPDVALDVAGVVQSDTGFVPLKPGAGTLGGPEKPFSRLYLGSAAEGSLEVEAPVTIHRKVSFPDASGEVGLVLRGTTGRIGGSALVAGQCLSGSANIRGADPSMVVIPSPAGVDPGDQFVVRAFVSSPGVILVKVCALEAGTPSRAKYNIRVLQ
jgi:hypothetical protein